MFEIENNKKIYQAIVNRIQDLIFQGKLKKGDILPPERRLAESLEVSRSSLREAIKALDVMGLIDSRHGGSNVISANMDIGVYKPLALFFKLNNGDITDVLLLRYMLETQIVKLLAIEKEGSAFKKLRKIVEETKITINREKLLQLDLDFHYELAHLTDNMLLIYFMEVIYNLAKEQMQVSHNNTLEPIDIYKNHIIILEALERKDGKAAALEISKGFEDGFPHIDFENLKNCI